MMEKLTAQILNDFIEKMKAHSEIDSAAIDRLKKTLIDNEETTRPKIESSLFAPRKP